LQSHFILFSIVTDSSKPKHVVINDGMDDFHAMSKKMEEMRKRREVEAQFWEDEIKQMNRWYQMWIRSTNNKII